MDLHDITLLGAESIAEGTSAFRFTKPEGFDFVPGQFANFTLVDPPAMDEAGPLRTFSIASAPHETALLVATRMRPSAFKTALAALPAGARLEMEGPFGEFALEPGDRPAAFVAGGIGITPFLSILRHEAHAGSTREIALYYGNRTPEAAAFLGEIDAFASRLPRFRVVHCMSDPACLARGWTGEKGFMDEKFLARHAGDPAVPLWYVVGPPAMTQAMHEVLVSLGVGDADLRVEDFAGY